MLNRNDPLIGAVQEVMRKNQAERDAVRAVNEKFGVTDRRALPHERQGEWDAAYNKVISEGAEVLNEELSPKQQKLAAIAGNKKKIDAPDLAAARKGGASHIEEEEQIDEASWEKEGSWSKQMKKQEKYAMKKLTPKAKEARDKAAEKIDEMAPPGREDQVKALKGKVGKESAFKIAWASYNKKKGK